MSRTNDYLFAAGPLSEYLEQRRQRLFEEIKQQSSDYILKVVVQDFADHLVNKYEIEPATILTEQIHVGDHGETQVDVSNDPMRFVRDRSRPCYIQATFAEFIVPYSGNAVTFSHTPSTFHFSPPAGTIRGQELRLRYVRTDHDAAAMRASFDQDLKSIEQFLGWAQGDIAHFNSGLRDQILQRVTALKEKYLKDRGMIAALGIPVRPRAGASLTYAAPVVRKKLSIQRPSVATGSFQPEPELSIEHYEHILGVISNMGQVMERSPSTFKTMDEENLRMHFLVQLNGHYEGLATGETFNFDGKTDILIRFDGRNIFIAECKFWKGAEKFTETIDQLLNYTSWRDTKTAILVFNRNKNLSAVLGQIPDLLKGHANFKRLADYKSETGFRCVLHHRDDKNRELTLTVLLFDVPS